MKICIFGDARSPHVQRLCPALAVLGNEVHIVCHHPLPILGATLEQFRVPRAGVRNPRRWNGRFHKYLLDFLRNFDIVNVQFLHDWGFTPEMLDSGCFVATAWGSDIVPPPGEQPPSQELKLRRVELLRQAGEGVTLVV